MNKIVIYGFGRMGITHYALLNQLFEKIEVTFVEPNVKLNYLSKKNIFAKFKGKSTNEDQEFDYALICSPPIYHEKILKECIKKRHKNIFVEKPFGGSNDDFTFARKIPNLRVGYVMRFNPIINWLKKNIDVNKVNYVSAYYNSNTIERKPKGWRNGPYSGVLNEMGSHIIDILIYLFDLSSPTIHNSEIHSIISDVDDICSINLSDNGIDYNLDFNWVNKEYRKPIFGIKIRFEENIEYNIDQQNIIIKKNNNIIKKISVADLLVSVPFYLRGSEFTLQMMDFIGDQKIMATVDDAIKNRNIINRVLNQ